LPAKKTFDNDHVLDQIMQRFWQQGYYHTSMDELVAMSGVKKQSLYNAFGDKHTIYLEALQRYHHLMLATTTQTMQHLEQTGATPLAVLMVLFTQGLTPTQDQPAGDLMANAIAEFATSDPAVTQLITHYYDDYLTLMASTILKGQANQTIIATTTSHTLAQSVLEARIGLQTRLRQGKSIDLDQRQQLWTIFLTPTA